MNLKFHSLLMAILFSLASVGAIAQEEVVVTRVTVWVKAIDKSGKPATGLNESDFELFEDGKKMETTCFEEAKLEPGEIDQTESTETLPAVELKDDPARKRVVFLIDLSNTSQAELLNLKEKTREFLTDLSEAWEVSLVSLYNGIIEVNVEGTTDSLALQSAFERIHASMMRDIDTLNQRRQLSDILRNVRGADPRIRDREISRACALAEEFIQNEKVESQMWMDSLRQFDKYVRKREDNPHTVVLFLSGGIASSPGKQYFETIAGSDLIRDMFPDDREFIVAFPECQYRYDSAVNRDLEKLIGKLNQNNITFYTINSRGPINDFLETVREKDRHFRMSDLDFLKDYQDFLVLIADDTGGTHFENSLNFKRGFDGILQDLNHQYVLCYKPPEHDKEGYHKIQVKTKLPGVKLRHRNGYYE